jgi:GTP-binding protein HflX
VYVSAKETGGLDPLRQLLLAELRELRPEVHLVIPAADGEALASVYRDGEVVRRQDRDGSIDVIVRLPRAALGRWRQRAGVEVVGVS